MNVRTLGVGSAAALAALYLKDSKAVNEAIEKGKEAARKNKALVAVGAVGIGALAAKWLYPWFQTANDMVQMGMELSELTSQLEGGGSGPGDTEAVAAHADEWKNYALTTWAQINKSARLKVDAKYNIAGIRRELKTLTAKDAKVKKWEELKLAVFSTLFENHFQTAFSLVLCRLVFTICFRRTLDEEAKNHHQDALFEQMAAGSFEGRSNPNPTDTQEDQRRFLDSLVFAEGAEKLGEDVHAAVSSILSPLPLSKRFTKSDFNELFLRLYNTTKQAVLERADLSERYLAPAPNERREPKDVGLAEMEGELHTLLRTKCFRDLIETTLDAGFRQVQSESNLIFDAEHPEGGVRVYFPNLITSTRKLTKLVSPILQEVDWTKETLLKVLETKRLEDFANVCAGIEAE